MALKSNRSIFNRDADLKLIELVRTNPVLYNPSQPKYSDIDTREITWKNIGENLQKPARKCKLRWASIRDMMRKKIKDRLRYPEQHSKSYRYEEELAFVIPYFKEGNSSNDYSDLLEESMEVEMPSEVYIDESLENTEDVKPILTFRECKNDSSLNRNLNAGTRRLNTSDPVDIFLMTVRNTLKKFSPYYLNQAKSKIFESVQDYELKQIEDDE